MSELTKEYLDQKFSELPTKQDFRSLEASIEDLARMTADGFEEIKSQLDVRKEVEILNQRM